MKQKSISYGRTLTFGKHKGELIMEVIRKQPWYIEWLLKNLDWFKLNKEELSYYNQTCADWLEAWNNVRYAFKKGVGASAEMYKTVEAYKKGELESRPISNYSCKNGMQGLQIQFSKAFDSNSYSEYSDIDDIVLGANPMSLF